MDTYNHIVLSVENDGASYAERQSIARRLRQTNNLPAALKAMCALIESAMARNPSAFKETDKSEIKIASQQLVEDMVQELNAADATSLAKPAGFARSAAGIGATTPSTIQDELEIPARKVSPDVLTVLRRAWVTTNKHAMVHLPSDKLERKLYTEVNEVLVAMGGKWKSGLTQAHVFSDEVPEDFEICFARLQETGSYTNPKDLGFFETSQELAARVVSMAELKPGMRVLEPSAGRNGRLALPAAAIVGIENVTCVEIFPANFHSLQRLGLQGFNQDFLAMKPPDNEAEKFDCIIANPPFSKSSDIDHVMHACRFLKSTGRLVTITSPSWESHSNSKKAELFRNFISQTDASVDPVESGAFKQSGTMVATRIIVIEGENLPWNRMSNDETYDEAEADDAFADAPAP